MQLVTFIHGGSALLGLSAAVQEQVVRLDAEAWTHPCGPLKINVMDVFAICALQADRVLLVWNTCPAPLKVGQPASLIFAQIAAGGSDPSATTSSTCLVKSVRPRPARARRPVRGTCHTDRD